MKTLGVGVLASVATVGLVPAGLGTVGQVAASRAVSQTVYQGSGLVLEGANTKAGKKVAKAADEIGCPLTINS